MKRNNVKYIVLVLLLAFVSRNEALAQEVSRSTAKRVAETFLNKNVRGGRGASVQLHDITAETEFQNFYIFSADSGFVIVAADERVIPILGYSNTNRFVTEDMPENLRWWLQGYEEQIQYVIDNHAPTSEKALRQWNAIIAGNADELRTRTTVGPLTETEWGQRGYVNGHSGDTMELYNKQCPYYEAELRHCLTGCDAIDLAQVMRYWQHPNHPHGSKEYTPNNPQHPEYYPLFIVYDNQSYDWSKMPTYLSAESSQEEIDETAKFIYHCATSIGANFGTSGTSSNLAAITSALVNYFYYKPSASHKRRSSYSDEEWKQMLKDELSASPGRPVCYRGDYDNGDHAHSLVCDGYTTDEDDYTYFHFNFGWCGSSSGYWSIDALHEYALSYIENQAAVFGIEPDEGTITATAYPEGSGMVIGSGTYRKGTLCTLSVTPNDYYVFSNWTKNGQVVSTESEFSFVVTEGATYVANFTRLHTITVEATPTNGGNVEGDGTYLEGDQCTITATPNPGYLFKGWYLPSGLLPINPLPTFTFTVTSNLHLIAKFQPATPTTDVYQYYCWFDQDYSTVQTGSFQYQEMFFALDASALSEGIHTLHVMLDDNGLSAPKTYLFLKAPVVSPVSSYNYHCWFDQDYETVQTGIFGGGGYSFALDASELDEGIHTLHVMLEGNDLTAAKTYVFLKAPVASPTSTYTYHCWFDQDYETVQTGTFGGEGYSFALDASELDEGIHTMHVMLEGNDLTAAKTYVFLKAPVTSPTSTYTYHCWFDQDYETVQTGTFGGEGYSFALDASELDNGLHFVNVMLEGNELTSAKRYLFCKKPAGDGGIYRWEYCINGNWSDAVATTFVPTIQTLDIQTMLPVDPLPIRSEDFEFELNGGQPEIYAKNTITFRFWDAENRFLDRSAVYVDATVHEPVVAEWIERNTTKTIVTPGPNQIHWFKLDANVGDLLEFMADHECTIQLFSPSGEQVFASMSVASIVFNGAYARENGIYYLAVHDVESGYDNTSVSYRYSGLATQSVALAQGWNWWAPTVNASLSQLEEALGASGISILSQSGSANNDNGQWSGTLESVTFGKMYKIRTAAVCSFTLTGLRPASVELSIAPGLNWFGFIGTAPTAIGTALNITPATGDKVISQDNGFAVYNGSTWEGTLTHLQPGCGYLYFSISSQPKTLIMGQ